MQHSWRHENLDIVGVKFYLVQLLGEGLNELGITIGFPVADYHLFSSVGHQRDLFLHF